MSGGAVQQTGEQIWEAGEDTYQHGDDADNLGRKFAVSGMTLTVLVLLLTNPVFMLADSGMTAERHIIGRKKSVFSILNRKYALFPARNILIISD